MLRSPVATRLAAVKLMLPVVVARVAVPPAEMVVPVMVSLPLPPLPLPLLLLLLLLLLLIPHVKPGDCQIKLQLLKLSTTAD